METIKSKCINKKSNDGQNSNQIYDITVSHDKFICGFEISNCEDININKSY